jgi:hypothetical protein
MKFYPYLLLFLILPAAAQTYDASKLRDLMGDPEKMQQEAEKMSKGIAEAASCMNDEAFKKMQAEGMAMAEKVKALCDKGDRKGAEQAVVEYSKKMAASEEFKKLQGCTGRLMAQMPASFVESGKAQAARNENRAGGEKPPHVCDMQ